jgi:hypothetical protein
LVKKIGLEVVVRMRIRKLKRSTRFSARGCSVFNGIPVRASVSIATKDKTFAAKAILDRCRDNFYCREDNK